MVSKHKSLKEMERNSGYDIIIKCVDVGQIQSGTSYGKEWRRQFVIVNDKTATKILVLWDDNIGKLEIGKYYEITWVASSLWDPVEITLDRERSKIRYLDEV